MLATNAKKVKETAAERKGDVNRKVPVGICIPMDLLEKIDRERGDKSRSEFVVQLIEKALKKEAEK